MPQSIASLRDRSESLLAGFCDPTQHFAFRTYDRSTRDGPLLPEDVLMANLLSLRLGWRDVIPLFAEGDRPAQHLRIKLDEALVELSSAKAFEDHASLDELEQCVGSLKRANLATEKMPGWTAVTVSKVLHRRRPQIVPLIDSRVKRFYGTRHPAVVRACLWRDISANKDWLRTAASKIKRPDGNELSLLRAADILIWSAGQALA